MPAVKPAGDHLVIDLDRFSKSMKTPASRHLLCCPAPSFKTPEISLTLNQSRGGLSASKQDQGLFAAAGRLRTGEGVLCMNMHMETDHAHLLEICKEQLLMLNLGVAFIQVSAYARVHLSEKIV